MGSKSETTQTTSVPEPTQQEKDLQAASLALLVQGPLSEGFTVKETKDEFGNAQYTFFEKPPAEVEAAIQTLPSEQQTEANRLIEEFGYNSAEFRGFSEGVSGEALGSATLSQAMAGLAQSEVDQAQDVREIEQLTLDRMNKFLKGELFEIPEETQTAIDEAVRESFAPEFAAIEQQFVRQGNTIEEARVQALGLVREQGVEQISKLNELRAKSEFRLNSLKGDLKQDVLELAAKTGRSPLDPTFINDAANTLGKEFGALEAGLAEAERSILDITQARERSIQDLSSQRMIGLEKERGAQEALTGAQASAQRAGQRFSLQTGLPLQQIQTGQAQRQLQQALSTQGLANQLSTLGGIQE